jgi:hypothetical protein
MPAALAAQLRADPRRPVPALRSLVLSFDAGGQLGVLAIPVAGAPLAGGVVGGTGDLQQLARPLDAALLCFLLWVPGTSSTSCDQAVFVDHAADARVSSDTVLLKIDWFG